MKEYQNEVKTPDVKIYKLKIAIHTNGIWLAIRYKDIIRLKTADNYTEISVSTKKETYCVLYSLDKFEKDLPSGFFRCHRSAIVNMACIDQIDLRSQTLTLSNKDSLPVSQSRIQSLRKRLNALPILTVSYCNHCETCDGFSECEIIRPFARRDKNDEDD